MMIRNGRGNWLYRGRWVSAIGCLLIVFLASCASGNAPTLVTTSSGTNGLANGTDPNAPPTPPPFPAFTVGAWVSNMSPEKGEQDRVYVLTRTHDASMTTASKPPPAGSVAVTVVIDGVSQRGTTDQTGYAYFDFPANAQPTKPSVILVTAFYQGKPYQTTTFYAVLPDLKGSPPPGATPTAHP
jgi:hypothetical protein